MSISQEDTVTAVIWQGNEEKPEDAGTGLSVTFTNIYDAADAVLKMDFISKALENKALEAGMFEFALYEETNMDTPVQKAFNTADGRVAFKDLTFDEVGTFYYLVKELTGDGNGYVTDKTTYRIEVTVTDNNGTLKASHKVLNTAADTITFRNVYDPAEIAHAISGQKTLNGRALLNNELYFVLAESDADGNEIEGGRTWHVGNQLDGSFAFEPITYTLPGEYYYTVHEEDAANKQGIQYDPVERLVKVTVTDNGSGVLSASSEVTINNAVQDGLHFINNYVPSSVEAAISGVKRLRGRTLQAEQFRFELYAADENGVPQGEPLETVTHDGQGAFAFAPRTYHKAGTYRYIVQEVKGGQIIDEITYDTMRYFVTVEVTDNLRGELSAVVVAHDEYLIPQEGVVFINTYGVVGGGTVRLQGAKMLTGREQKDGELTFELYQTGADYLVADGQQPWLTVGNVGGRFAFELMYGSEHMNQIFYYVLREKNAGQIIDGIEYSDQTYQIMVMVEAGRDGMVETITVIHSDDKLAQNVLFINHARASGSAGQQPPTGDRSTPLLWLMLLTGSAAVLYTSYRRRRLHG